MSTIPVTSPRTPAPGTARRPSSARGLLVADAGLCAVTGVLAAALAPAVADLLGPDVPTVAVRVVGVALVVYALDLALVAARGSATWVRRTALAAAFGNVAWVAATVGLVAAGAFSTAGAVVVLTVAAVVGDVGLLQLRAARAAGARG